MTVAAMQSEAPVARVNGVALNEPGECLSADALRQRACTELLRQAASAQGISAESTAGAIDALLQRELQVPDPAEEVCLRHFEANADKYARGERLALRHVLFAVAPGVDVKALRQRAEALLLDLRCADPQSGAFVAAARQWSNCPSGSEGGDLGWVTREDCAQEFAQQVFGQQTVGILPRLVHSRFGFHVVEVTTREPGAQPVFEEVRDAVALRLRQQAWANALRQYLQLLAAGATLEGVDLQGASTPLVQ